MAADRKPNNLTVSAFACALLWATCAFGQATVIRHHQIAVEGSPVSPAVTQAESAIEKQDYAATEHLLQPVVTANHKDDRAWYDLAYVYRATQRRELAVDAY